MKSSWDSLYTDRNKLYVFSAWNEDCLFFFLISYWDLAKDYYKEVCIHGTPINIKLI